MLFVHFGSKTASGCNNLPVSKLSNWLKLLYIQYAGHGAMFSILPTHSFIPGLKPSFTANPSYRSLSFSSAR